MDKLRTTQEFQDFLANNPVAVVKFYTTWCVDCKRIEKSYAEWTQENHDRAAFAEIDADELHEIAERFEVRGIPSFLVFKGKELEDRLYSRDAKTAKQVIHFCEQALEETAAR